MPAFAPLRRVRSDERLHLEGHLHELRQRLLISAAALAGAFALAYAFHPALISLLERPLPRHQHALITLSPTEPFMTTMKVCFWAAVLIALPIWFYQLYAFCIPAVADRPRRVALAVAAGVAGLFLAGVAFGYLVVLGVALKFLLGFGGGAFDTELRAGECFSFATTMLLAAGVIFEVPAAMVAFARLGIVRAAQYRRHWRIAIVVIAAIAAFLPGGDPLSMLLLMAPQILLYALGIWLAGLFERPARDPWLDEADSPWSEPVAEESA